MQPRSPAPTKRPLLASLVIWLVPALCLLDALFALTWTAWRPFGAIEHALVGSFLLWLASAGLLLHPRTRATIALHWRELLLCGTITLAGWTLLEFAANHVEQRLRGGPPFHTRGANIHNVFTPDPDHLPGIQQPSHYTTGPDGVRAASAPEEGDVRVLCIGGSTTECVYLDDTETWPALLPANAKTDFWAGNVGVSGFDTNDHLQFVRTSPLLNGIALLVVQPGINDLWRHLAGEVEAMDYGRFARAANTEDAPGDPSYRPWWTRSRAIQLYHTWRQPPPPPEQREGIGGPEYKIRREKRAAAPLTNELPPLNAGLEAYGERINAIIEGCRARKVPVLFTTQPVVWRSGLPQDAAARCWFGWLPDGSYLTLGALREAMDRYNAALLDVCAKASVPCVDLSPLHGKPELFYDDCHFTEVGAREVAELAGPEVSRVLREGRQ